MPVLSWGTPPPTKKNNGVGKWRDIMESLKSRPNEWALLHDGVDYGTVPTSMSSKKTLYEVVRRTVRENGITRRQTWARYIGPTDQTERSDEV
jgi:hypothetical protein